MAKNDIIEIRPLEIETFTLRIRGTSPLIMHKWSEKARKEIRDKQMKATKTTAKEAKSPIADFIGSIYWMDGEPADKTEEGFLKAVEAGARFGFPATAIKQATLSAAYRMGWVENQTGLRGAFFIKSNEEGLVEIKSDTPLMREDMVKVGMGTADIRYRGQFNNWYADPTIEFNKNGKYTKEQLVNFMNAGGFVCGIGEWRPERDGQFGMFQVDAN